MIFKDNKILMGKQISSHGDGQFGVVGGHLEYMESFKECALREIKEECGIEVKNIRFQFLMNLKAYAPKHYVHIGLTADWASGEPRVLEPDKMEGWDWYDLDKIPEPRFATIDKALLSYRTGKTFFDS